MNNNINENDIKAILSNADIPIIDEDVNYWFLRTSGGADFENFYFGNYIAIGWDDINDFSLITPKQFDTLKNIVKEIYPDDAKPGSTASQLIHFVSDMKPGDYVLIPGANCERIAFGIITSDAYIYEPTAEEQFNANFEGINVGYLKRRNVAWINDAPLERSSLDPLLKPIIYTYGTIVNANPYSAFINRSIYDLYYRNGELHSIYNITKSDNISIYDFYEFINNIFYFLDCYSEISGFEVNKSELSIKASINSPGPVEIITGATSAFIALSALSIFLNGAHVKFSFNIFNIASGQININSPGLIDKITKLMNASTDNNIKLTQSEEKLLDSKNKLKIKKKKHK